MITSKGAVSFSPPRQPEKRIYMNIYMYIIYARAL